MTAVGWSEDGNAAPVSGWLCIPPRQQPAPPTVTRAPLLPTNDLAWPDFERLCVRLLAGEVEDGDSSSLKGTGVARLYGTPGQAQDGIDLFARDPLPLGVPAPTRHVVALQSRRVAGVSAIGLERAVADFEQGHWAGRTRRFIYATSASAVRTQLSDAIERQAVALAERGIDFVVWDREAMADLLRNRPKLVDDFFGRAWVEAFCGSEAVSTLGTRLDLGQVSELRMALRGLYTAAFAVADSGQLVTGRSGARPVPLAERFVTPLVEPIGTLDQATAERSRRAAGIDRLVDPGSEHGQGFDERASRHAPTVPAETAITYRGSGSLKGDWYTPSSWMQPDESDDSRGQSVDFHEWLGLSEQQLVLGEPGVGKSTALRFLAIDLLADDPQWPNVARRWGDRLPVWLPFHYFTQRVESTTGQAASVVEAIRAWFQQHDFGHVMPLVERALSDERLLLLVDGLDEWATPAAGAAAAAALETFVGARQASIIMTSRPYALDRIALVGQWQTARIAPLTRSQQRELALPFFRDVARQVPDDMPDPAEGFPQLDRAPEARREQYEQSLDTFMEELRATPDLRAMAAVPLFLVLLVGLRLVTGGRLPERRFEVFDRALRLLVTDHRSRRRVAAAVTNTGPLALADRQLRAVMAQVAYSAQVRGDLRAITIERLHHDLVDALLDPDVLALQRAEAIALATDIADVAEGDLGLLVRLGPHELGFIHRSLHEHLAAEHLAHRFSLEEMQTIVAERAADATWREVLLGTLWVTGNPRDRRGIAEAVLSAVSDAPEGIAAAELVAEMVFGPYELPGDSARGIAALIAMRLASHPLLSHRAALMRHFVSGSNSVVLGPMVTDLVTRWAVQVEPPSEALIRNLPNACAGNIDSLSASGGTVPGTEQTSETNRTLLEVVDLLLLGLRNLDPPIVWSAASTLLGLGRLGEPQRGTVRERAKQQLLESLDDPSSSAEAAAALAVLSLWWPDDDAARGRLEQNRDSQSLAVRAVVLANRIGVLSAGLEGRLGDDQILMDRLNEAEVDWLRSLMFDNSLRFQDAHDGVVIAAVAAAISGDRRVRDHLVDRMRADHGSDLDTVWTFGPMVFGNDIEVATVVAEKISGEEKSWPALNLGFGANPLAIAYAEGSPHRQLIAEAVESRLAVFDHKHHDVLLHSLAQIDRGPRLRQALLDRLTEGGSFPHWAASALVEHFSDDEEAMETLRRALNGPPEGASRIAGVTLAVLGPEAGRRLLLEMLRGLYGQSEREGRRARFDIISAALVACLKALDDPEVSEATCAEALPLLPSLVDPWYGDPQFDMACQLSSCPSARAVLDDRFLRDSASERLSHSSPDRYLPGFLRACAGDKRHLDELLARCRTLLRAQPPSIRAELNRLLASGAVPPQHVLLACASWADDAADSVKSLASLAYHRALLAGRAAGLVDEATLEDAVAYATDVAASYGPDHEARRRAAWVGLCVLGAWDQVAARRETIGEAEPVGVPLSDPFTGPDRVLLGEIARCWQQLREVFGADLLRRLSGLHAEADEASAWGALATVAGQSPQLKYELRAAVSEHPSLLADESVLLWYVTDPSRNRESATRAVAAAVAARNNQRDIGVLIAQDPGAFEIDVELLEQLLTEMLERGSEGAGFGDAVLECVAVLRPEHPEVQRVWRQLRAQMGVALEADEDAPIGAQQSAPRSIHFQTAYAVAFSAAPSGVVPELVVNALKRLSSRGAYPYVMNAMVRHARRRLARDDAAAEALRRIGASEETPVDLAAQLAVILTTVPAGDSGVSVAATCLARLRDGVPILVTDPTSGVTLSAKVSLLNAIRQPNG